MENNNSQIMQVPVKNLVQLENSRVNYDEQKMVELMSNMKANGLMQAIGISPIGEAEQPSQQKYQVVFGNRRMMAAKKLGWETIEAKLIPISDRGEQATYQDIVLKNASENMVRDDVSLTEQGAWFSKLRQQNMTPSEIAVRVGVSKSRVMQALEAFSHIPTRHRNKVAGGSKVGTGTGDKNGKMSGSTAMKALSVARKHGLTGDNLDRLFDFAVEDGVSGDKLRVVSGLISAGRTIDEAIDESKKIKFVTLSLAMRIENCDRLEDKYKTGIHDVLLALLQQHEELGIVAAPGRKTAVFKNEVDVSIPGGKNGLKADRAW